MANNRVFKKTQVLLFVFLLIALVGILGTGLAGMWQAQYSVEVLNEDNLEAFYVAQSGLEYAKARKASASSERNWPASATTINFGYGNFTITQAALTCPTGGGTSYSNCRTIYSIGRCGRAQRRVAAGISLGSTSTVGDEAQFSWYEY